MKLKDGSTVKTPKRNLKASLETVRGTKRTPKMPWGSTVENPNTGKSVTVTDGATGEEVDLRFESPTSSNILGASYKPLTGELTVQFHGGRSYRYMSIPRDLWDDFDAAESKGAFFAARIKDKGFGGERV